MANVKCNEKTYYIPSDKFLVCLQSSASVHKDASTDSKSVVSVHPGQVFSVSFELHDMYRIKPGWIKKDSCKILVPSASALVSLDEPFVVKVIHNIPVLTEPSPQGHATTVVRPGELYRVIGESEDYFQLETGDFISKIACRRY